jgi:hypothetical protein
MMEWALVARREDDEAGWEVTVLQVPGDTACSQSQPSSASLSVSPETERSPVLMITHLQANVSMILSSPGTSQHDGAGTCGMQGG